MRCAAAEIKRAATGRAFLYAAGAAWLCVLAGAFSSVFKILESGLCAFGEHRTVFLRALNGDAILFGLPIIAAAPFAASFAEDVKSGFSKLCLARTSKGSYIAGKGLAAGLSGGLAAALGLAAAYLTLFLLLSPFEYRGGQAPPQVIPKILTGLLTFFLCGCFWAEVGLCASALTVNVHLAYASPFIAYYLLIILQERYLRAELMLNPRNWLTIAGDRPLKGWSCPILVLLLTCLLFLAFLLVGRRRLGDDTIKRRVCGRERPAKRLEKRIVRSRVSPRKSGGLAVGLHEIFAAVRYDLSTWRGSVRVLLTFALAFILCFLLSDKAASFAFSVRAPMQAFEPFIWTFGDANSVLMISLLLILLFADIPYLGAGTPYYLVRMRRRTWALGQVVYVLLATLIYVAFIFAVTTLICMKNSFIGNKWSETAAILGYSGAGSRIVLPALIKTLEMSRPYQCAAAVFALMAGYTLVLSLVMLLVKLRRGRGAGIIAAFVFSLFGFLLNPELIKALFRISDEELYKARVAVGWLSPLNHATYHMHSFGWDLLPKLWQTYLFFGVLSVILVFLIIRAMRKYSFNFLGTEEA